MPSILLGSEVIIPSPSLRDFLLFVILLGMYRYRREGELISKHAGESFFISIRKGSFGPTKESSLVLSLDAGFTPAVSTLMRN